MPSFIRSQTTKNAIGVLCIIGVTVYFVQQFNGLHKWAADSAKASTVDWRQVDDNRPDATLNTLHFQKVVSNVQVKNSASGLEVSAGAPDYTYLLSVPLAEKNAAAVALRYRVKLESGQPSIGILSGDSQKWLGTVGVYGEPGTIHEGQLSSAVEPGSQLIMDAGLTHQDEMRATILKLDITYFCLPEPIEPLREIFARVRSGARVCHESAPASPAVK